MTPRLLSALPLVLLAGSGACDGCEAQAPVPVQPQGAEVVEVRPPNAQGQVPVRPDQTRAPLKRADLALDVRVVAKGLSHPWGLAFLPGGGFLVTERGGAMRLVGESGAVSPPLAGVPEVNAKGQGGLFDLLLGPSFESDGTFFFSYAERREGGNGTAVARAQLVRDGAPRLENVVVIWRVTPTLESGQHFGGRLAWSRDGTLWVTSGERGIMEGRIQARRHESAFGKTVRLAPDGTAPSDNPFVKRAGALPEIYSIGHRNPQGAAVHPRTGELWVVEHGPRGGDELNRVRAGGDYGWPAITYGVEYSGEKIGEGLTQAEGIEQPVYFWDPSIAPSGLAFYEAELFPAWKGSLFVGALAGRHLARLTLEGERVVGEERLLADRARIRDVRVGPEGAVYVLTDEDAGELLALFPQK